MSRPSENAPTSTESEPGAALHVSARTAAIVILLVVAAALGFRLLDAGQASTAALKLVSATLVIGIVPGALATLLWAPRPHLWLLEVIGFGIAISFGIAHLLTILAVSAHLSPPVILAVLLIGVVLMAGRIIQRPSSTIVLSVDELIVFTLLAALVSALYILGAPFDSAEDQIHAAIARRLSQLAHPQLDNLYVTPGIVYTYPFPGTHYFMGLIARLGDIDALFLYHKIRFFWGTTTLVMLYLTARTIFGTRAMACGVIATCMFLVWNGVFLIGFPTGWGNLVAYSHASDIAMTVLLPSLLAVAFEYLRSDSTRERWFFLVATTLLVLMITMVHMREMVQFAAYLGCFFVTTAICRTLRPYLRRTAALLAMVLALAAMFTVWQAQMFPLVDTIVGEERAKLASITAANSLRALTFSPAPALLNDWVQKFDETFGGLTPFFLFAGPAVIVLFRRQPLVWLASSSTFVYLLVMSVPLLAIPYIYVTYFEMLHLPVRNVIFFMYLFAGASVYALVVALSRIDRTRLSLPAAGAALGLVALLSSLGLNRSHLGFFAPLIAAYGITLLFLTSESSKRRSTWRTLAPALVGVFALAALWPDHPAIPRSDPVSVRWRAGVTDAERVAFERQLSLKEAEPKPDRTEALNVWNYRLSDVSIDNVRRIVSHPAVADTQHIDRSSFTVLQQPPRSDHPTLGVLHVSWLQYPGGPLLIGTAVLVWALGFVVPVALGSSRGGAAALEGAIKEPFYRHALPYALFIVPFVLWSARPTLSPLTAPPMQPSGRADTPHALLAQMACVTTPRMTARFTEHLFPGNDIILPESTVCPPDAALIGWVQANVPVEGVLAIDRWNPYPPSMFVPQQMVVFPTLDASFIYENKLFRDYYGLFDERMRRYRVQPFFNAVETPAERGAYVDTLGVTHVLVNPAHYDELRPVLDGLPDQFVLKYSGAKWAVYEVQSRSS